MKKHIYKSILGVASLTILLISGVFIFPTQTVPVLIAVSICILGGSYLLAYHLADDITTHLQDSERIIEEQNIQIARQIKNLAEQEKKFRSLTDNLSDMTSDQRAEQVRREFSANVSHELKTPLTSISGYAELMQNGMVQDKDIPVFAGKIYTEAARMITLVNDIIKISQLDEKEIRRPKETIDLYELTKEVHRDLLSVAEKRNVTLYLEGQTVYVLTVRQMMYDMIYNLCENGIKYNVSGGEVHMTVHEDEDGKPVFQISDTGIGIPAEYQERIFERFYRIDKSHSKQTGGTGLGLSIVKHAVENQGGYIEVHSEPHKGATITVHLDG